MRNIYPDDPMERRRNELRSSAEASGFANDDLRNLGEPDFWELHFDRGTNAECTTAAEAEGWAVTSLADVDASSNRGSSWLF